MLKSCIVFACALSLPFVASEITGDEKGKYKIIVNAANPVSELRKGKLSDIFLKKIQKWETKERVLPVDLHANSPIRQSFSIEVLEKKVSAIRAYWQKKIFSGRGVPPPELASDEKVVEFVEEHPGAIGYVSKSTSLENRKVKIPKVKMSKESSADD